MLEEGAFNRLLDQHYNTERPLPPDRAILYRLARAENAAERKAVDQVLARFFTLTEEGYVERGAMQDITACREKQIKASRAAQARRNRRLLKAEDNACKTDATGHANPDANTVQNACKSDAHQTPVTNLQAPDTTPTPNPSRETRDAGAPPDGNGVVGGRIDEENASPPAPSLHQLAEAIRQARMPGTAQNPGEGEEPRRYGWGGGGDVRE
jgi:uncharacterized protein YdaU (DUF1376 family)